MPLTTLLTVRTRPERARDYEAQIATLAAKAIASGESFHWNAFQPAFGELNALHFASTAGSYGEIAARGDIQQLVRRVLGEGEAAKWLEQSAGCVASMEQVVLLDRPDLSYEPDTAPAPAAVVTAGRARPGGRDAMEELIRKVAEAVPKTGDPRRIAAFQEVIGQLGRYWTVNPIESLEELDRMLAPEELLVQAFGSAEGGLVFRAGLEAIEELRREVVVLRADLSNPEQP